MKCSIMENYPYKTVCISVSLTFLSYFLGFLIAFTLNPIFGIIYLIICILTILISMKFRCSYCYYHGKRCNSGFGLVSAIIYKEGDKNEFGNPKYVGITALFSFGTMILPLIGGIILLISAFSIYNLFLLIIYFLISIIPNLFIRKGICENCKQGEIGCPAYDHMKNQSNDE